ncbi:hypothetical protein GOBAR_DD34307 [Gossypium barbadense]|nr:hypothetical protein GOBAR_DD34307 [Gossypium barbadense]
MNRASDLLMAVSIGADLNKNKIIEQAVEAMEELFKLAIMGEPLWQHNGNGGMETLNGFQYLREFGSFDATMEQIMRMVEVGEPQCFLSYDCNCNFDQDVPSSFSKLNFEPLNIETSRETVFVEMNPMNIIQLLMDMVGILFPLVPLHYCQEFAPCIIRTENFHRMNDELEHHTGANDTIHLDGFSTTPLISIQLTPTQGTSFAFSAKRWIATINRHCQWLTTSMARTAPTTDGVLIPQEGKGSLLKLAEKMTKNFFNNINSCSENVWSGLPQNFAAQDVRLRYGNILKVLGKPSGNIVIFTTSIQILVPMEVLFDFLRHERTRNKWDLLSNQRHVRELVYVSNGENPGNRVSIMQVNSSPNKIEILYL